MGLFSNLKKDGLEQAKDNLGGGFAARETDIYTGKLTAAYLTVAASGAQAISLVFNDGSEYREDVYITNKKGENFFLNKNDNTKKVPLPGFTVIDDICLMLTEKPLSEQDTEEKVVKVYDFEAQADVNKSVQMLVDLLDKEISFGIVKETVNKQVKGSDGYVDDPNGGTRDQNHIDKVYHTETKLTVLEAQRGLEAGVFWDQWLEKHKGVTRDKTSKKKTGTAGAPPAAGAGTTAPKTSLFGKKTS